jgi:hypothetical protein
MNNQVNAKEFEEQFKLKVKSILSILKDENTKTAEIIVDNVRRNLTNFSKVTEDKEPELYFSRL